MHVICGKRRYFVYRDDCGSVPFVRYLPVTPMLCLRCDLTRNPEEFMHSTQDFTQEQKETIQAGFVNVETVETVQRINTRTAQCPQNLVLSSDNIDYARGHTTRYSRFRVEIESTRLRDHRGIFITNRTRCVERMNPLTK
jgi:uncharacterized protein YfdQ (DUF2303 family)